MLVREETDCGLLNLMADGKQPWADAAYRAFYERHNVYLWKVCARSARAMQGDIWIEDVFNDTFAQAYKKAHQFTLPADVTAAEAELRIRGWLGAIASNFIRGKLRKFGREVNQDEPGWEQLAAATALTALRTGPELSVPSNERQLIDAALKTLTDREALVLHTTFQYHRIGEKFQRLPNKVATELATALATTPENLRKIRERAMNKIRQYVERHQSTAQQDFA